MLGRIVGVTLLISVLVGFAGGCFAVLISEQTLDWVPKVLSGRGLIGLVFIGACVSLPVSIPAGVVGSAIAFAMLRRKQGKSTGLVWRLRGAVFGAMLGVFTTWMWFRITSPVLVGPPNALAVPIYGGIVGLITGIIVGGYYRRIQIEAR